MALACSVLEVVPELSVEESYDRLRQYRVTLGQAEFLGRRVDLEVTVRELTRTPRGVAGVLEEVTLLRADVDGVSQRLPVRLRNAFRLAWVRGGVYALLFTRRSRVPRVAERLSQALFGEGGHLQAMSIPPEKLRRLCSGEDAKVRQVVLSVGVEGVRTVVVYGRDLELESLSRRFPGSREVYVVFESSAGVFGVGSAGYVVALSQASHESLEEYVLEKVIPLLEPPEPDAGSR